MAGNTKGIILECQGKYESEIIPFEILVNFDALIGSLSVFFSRILIFITKLQSQMLLRTQIAHFFTHFNRSPEKK